MIRRLACALLTFAFLAGGSGAQAPAPWQLGMPASCRSNTPTRDVNNIRRQMYWAQEYVARPGDDLWKWLVGGLTHSDPSVQETAVRALGRLEQPDLVPALARKLSAPSPAVRREAANGIGQAVMGATGTQGQEARKEVSSQLRRRLAEEADAGVRGVLCETLGRLAYEDAAEAQLVEKLLVNATLGVDGRGDAPLAVRVGAAKGLESLLRQQAKLLTPSGSTIVRLRALAVTASDKRGGAVAAETEDERHLRRLALLALGPHQAADAGTLARALADREWESRRIAVRIAGAGLRAAKDGARQERMSLIRGALRDADWHVRFEAVSAFARYQEAPACPDLLRAVNDNSTHVALLAIDQLSRCSAASATEVTGILDRQIRTLPASGNTAAWHRAAHALVTLARVAPDRARADLRRFRSHGIWQVRMYAARAAAVLKEAGLLRELATDPDDNVRNAAVTGLAEIERHAADDVYIAQLGRSDSQLLMTVARALRGTGNSAALPALLAALGNLARRYPSRDARLALLERIGELGSAAQAEGLAPMVNDPDPLVAASAAATLEKWTGTRPAVAEHVRKESLLTLSPEEIQRLERATVFVRMRNGGSFTLALLTDQAPVSAAGFARLVECGYYNGLTFHRVEPNFVVQGGSPGANEYAGYPGYMRDEVGLASNVRGSVGLSTRGRNTGDAQWYVNLVDNARLDHNYTVFAKVVSGMDVVDAILEGGQIEEIKILDGLRK